MATPISRPEQHKPKVSVCILAYNYAEYIEGCLKSVLDQETDFEFEVIIGDDDSKDGTREIILKYKELYPDKLIPLLHSPNIGGCANYLAVHGAARGDYIAHLDGDDYMLPGKLQAQADFLDKNPDYSVVKHRMMHLRPATGEFFEDSLQAAVNKKQTYTVQDIMRTGSIGTHSSKMYRQSVARKSMNWPDQFLDWLTDIVDIGQNKMYLMENMLAVQRVGIGVSSNQIYKTRKILIENIDYAIHQYKSFRPQISALSLRIFLGDLFFRRDTVHLSMRTSLRSFRLSTLYNFLISFIESRKFKMKK